MLFFVPPTKFTVDIIMDQTSHPYQFHIPSSALASATVNWAMIYFHLTTKQRKNSKEIKVKTKQKTHQQCHRSLSLKIIQVSVQMQ